VVCDTRCHAATAPRGELSVLTIGFLEDLQKSLAKRMAA